MSGVDEHQEYGLLIKHLLGGRGGVASGNVEISA
jgi:hypothetical protein